MSECPGRLRGREGTGGRETIEDSGAMGEDHARHDPTATLLIGSRFFFSAARAPRRGSVEQSHNRVATPPPPPLRSATAIGDCGRDCGRDDRVTVLNCADPPRCHRRRPPNGELALGARAVPCLGSGFEPRGVQRGGGVRRATGPTKKRAAKQGAPRGHDAQARALRCPVRWPTACRLRAGQTSRSRCRVERPPNWRVCIMAFQSFTNPNSRAA